MEIILEIVLIHIFTIILSTVLEFIKDISLFKIAADKDYIIDYNKYLEVAPKILDKPSNMFFIRLIPFYNIIDVFNRFMKLKNDNVFFRLKTYNLLDFMSKDEREQYKNNPTALNAYTMSLKKGVKEEGVKAQIIIPYEDEESIITYKMLPNEKIFVLDVTGPAKRLSKKEIIKKIEDAWKITSIDGLLKYGSTDKFLDAVNNEQTISLQNKELDEEEINQNLEKSLGLTKEELVGLRDDLIKSMRSLDKPKKLTKKKEK